VLEDEDLGKFAPCGFGEDGFPQVSGGLHLMGWKWQARADQAFWILKFIQI
jgi:hypothetical protein